MSNIGIVAVQQTSIWLTAQIRVETTSRYVIVHSRTLKGLAIGALLTLLGICIAKAVQNDNERQRLNDVIWPHSSLTSTEVGELETIRSAELCKYSKRSAYYAMGAVAALVAAVAVAAFVHV